MQVTKKDAPVHLVFVSQFRPNQGRHVIEVGAQLVKSAASLVKMCKIYISTGLLSRWPQFRLKKSYLFQLTKHQPQALKHLHVTWPLLDARFLLQACKPCACQSACLQTLLLLQICFFCAGASRTD